MLMIFRFMRQALCQHTYMLTTLLVLMLALTACGSRLSAAEAVPRAEPTSQPVAAVVAQPQQFNPTINLSPSSGHGGIYVQVTGSGWPPHMMVIAVLADPSGISTTVASADTDATGNLATGFLYPIETRWLLPQSYTVTAESADGQYRASAQFTVIEPGAELTPTALAMSAASPVPTMTPTVMPTATSLPTSTPTNTPVPATETPVPTPVPTATPTVAPTTSSQVAEVTEANAAEGVPVIEAALIPDGRRGDYQQLRVELSAIEGVEVEEMVAVLQVPRVNDIEEVKTKSRDKFALKVKEKRIELDAPKPQRLLERLRRDGGIRVEDGQLIEFKMKGGLEYKADIKNDTLRIEAPELRLHVTAVDTAGNRYQVTVLPPVVPNEDDNDDDDRDDDDRDDDDRDRDRDRKRGKDDDNDRGDRDRKWKKRRDREKD